MKTYFGFCDPSGGSSDSMTLAIAHQQPKGLLRKSDLAICDGHWERRAPFSPDDVVRAFAETLREYKVSKVVGDKYAGAWVAERFREHGIAYVPSEKTKSELFLECLSLINSGRARIPGDRRLRAQFESLERRASRNGRDSVDHPPSGHDDAANCVAGALCLAAASSANVGEPFCQIITGRERYPADPYDVNSNWGFEKSRGPRTPSFGR